jgi:uncharacterized protein (TIGR02452 family)
MDLKKVADETKAELPSILAQLPAFDAAESSVHDIDGFPPLEEKDCPRHVLRQGDADAGQVGTRVRVFDMDTFDAAMRLAPGHTAHIHLGITSIMKTGQTKTGSEEEDHVMEDASEDATGKSNTSLCFNPLSASTAEATSGATTPYPTSKPVAVLNLASESKAGGGWQNGALAQEEALCYRSSLHLSLEESYYPLPSLSAIYSPSVLIIRDAMSRGHSLLTPAEHPTDLPVTSVISVAALRNPALTDDRKHYKNGGQRAETKRKIRLTLRVAAQKGHTKLVLGALGCGVFGNPPKEVAECFLEVLREKEFQGGWWEEIAFAILDNVRGEHGGKDGVGNFGVFYRVLEGRVV